jgi:hypothetical protein
VSGDVRVDDGVNLEACPVCEVHAILCVLGELRARLEIKTASNEQVGEPNINKVSCSLHQRLTRTKQPMPDLQTAQG